MTTPMKMPGDNPHLPLTEEQMAAFPNCRLTITGPISGPNRYWFRPYTHWHEVSSETACVLRKAGYGFK